MAFTRIDEKPIDLRYQIYNPDYVLVLDDGLMNVVDVFSGIKDNTEVIINIPEEYKGTGEHNIYSIDATGIALDLLGRNIVNTIILGYFAKKTQAVSIESLVEVIKETLFDFKRLGASEGDNEKSLFYTEKYNNNPLPTNFWIWAL